MVGFFSSTTLNGRRDIVVQAGCYENSGDEVDVQSASMIALGNGRRKRKAQASGKTRKNPVNPTYCNL